MNKKTVFILLGIILVILIVLLAYFLRDNQIRTTKNSENQIAQNITISEEAKTENLSKALPEENSTTTDAPKNTSNHAVSVVNDKFINWSHFSIPIPSGLIVLSKTNGVVIAPSKTSVHKIAIGKSLQPGGECNGDYFYNTRTQKKTDPYQTEEERKNIIVFSCFPARTLAGYSIPIIATQYLYSDFASGEQIKKWMGDITWQMLEQIYEYPNPAYSFQEINALGEKIATWSYTIPSVNGKPLLYEGPNAGGSSPVFFPSESYPKRAWGVQPRLEDHEMRMTLLSALTSPVCSRGMVESYIRGLAPGYRTEEGVMVDRKPSSHEEFAKDLACLGDITFKETYFGIE